MCIGASVAVTACTEPKVDKPEASALPASSEAKTTAAMIRQFYPLACASNAASWQWATCYDTTKGFDQVLACATTARDQARGAQARLPVGRQMADPSCGATVETKARAFVDGTVAYLDDLVAWLSSRRAALTGPLRTTSIQDLNNEKLKAGIPHDFDAKYGSGADSLSFGTLNRVECTKTVYRCGLQDDDVCWLQKVASSRLRKNASGGIDSGVMELTLRSRCEARTRSSPRC